MRHVVKPIQSIGDRILAAVANLQGTYRSKKTGKVSHGVHSVYSGLYANVVKACGGDAERAKAEFEKLVSAGKLYSKPSKGGFSYATTPFPVSARTSQADAFFAGL